MTAVFVRSVAEPDPRLISRWCESHPAHAADEVLELLREELLQPESRPDHTVTLVVQHLPAPILGRILGQLDIAEFVGTLARSRRPPPPSWWAKLLEQLSIAQAASVIATLPADVGARALESIDGTRAALLLARLAAT